MILKYVTRIFYAVLAALGLMLVFYISDARARKAYLGETGAIALEEGRYEAFLPGGFHKRDPLINQDVTIDGRSFKVIIYEVGYYESVTDGVYVAKQGITVLLHQQSGDPLEDMFDVAVHTDGPEAYPYLGYHVDPLDLYAILNQDTGESIILTTDFPEGTHLESIDLLDDIEGEKVLYQLTLDLTLSDLSIKQQLETYANTNQAIPTEDFDEIIVIPRVRIDTSRAVLIGILIYVVSISALTYGLFFFKRKRLGKKAPTEGVMKDIEKMKNEQHRTP
jgi:hypothetical protein